MKFRLFILIVSIVTLVACNTIEGIGKDLKKGGEAIQNAATGNK